MRHRKKNSLQIKKVSDWIYPFGMCMKPVKLSHIKSVNGEAPTFGVPIWS